MITDCSDGKNSKKIKRIFSKSLFCTFAQFYEKDEKKYSTVVGVFVALVLCFGANGWQKRV